MLELAQRDRLLLLEPFDVLGNAAQVGLERLLLPEQLDPVGIERRGSVGVQRPELFALAVVVQGRDLGLCAPKRQLLAAPAHTCGEVLVLERVLLIGELGGRKSSFARLAQPVETLAFVVVGRLRLTFVQQRELVAREEIGVARDDGSLLRDLFLPHPHRAALLGPLVEVLLQPLLVLGRAPDGFCDVHRP